VQYFVDSRKFLQSGKKFVLEADSAIALVPTGKLVEKAHLASGRQCSPMAE
jgi:hypothetical protein